MERIEFTVIGSRGDRYRVAFEKDGAQVHAYCTCQAGQKRTYCKHRFCIIDGQIDSVETANPDDILKVKRMMSGSDLERRYNQLLSAEAEHIRTKQLVDRARAELVKAMYP